MYMDHDTTPGSLELLHGMEQQVTTDRQDNIFYQLTAKCVDVFPFLDSSYVFISNAVAVNSVVLENSFRR